MPGRLTACLLSLLTRNPQQSPPTTIHGSVCRGISDIAVVLCRRCLDMPMPGGWVRSNRTHSWILWVCRRRNEDVEVPMSSHNNDLDDTIMYGAHVYSGYLQAFFFTDTRLVLLLLLFKTSGTVVVMLSARHKIQVSTRILIYRFQPPTARPDLCLTWSPAHLCTHRFRALPQTRLPESSMRLLKGSRVSHLHMVMHCLEVVRSESLTCASPGGTCLANIHVLLRRRRRPRDREGLQSVRMRRSAVIEWTLHCICVWAGRGSNHGCSPTREHCSMRS
jgi:hypothetical protein